MPQLTNAFSRLLARTHHLKTSQHRLSEATLALSKHTLLALHSEALLELDYPPEVFAANQAELAAYFDSPELSPFVVFNTLHQPSFTTTPLYCEPGIERTLLQGTCLDWLNLWDSFQAVEAFTAYTSSFDTLPLSEQSTLLVDFINAQRILEINVKGYVLPRLQALAASPTDILPELRPFAEHTIPLVSKIAHLVSLPQPLAPTTLTIDHAAKTHLISNLSDSLLRATQQL